jgi:hypothetical protein
MEGKRLLQVCIVIEEGNASANFINVLFVNIGGPYFYKYFLNSGH